MSGYVMTNVPSLVACSCHLARWDDED